jgi:hypothetical protein
MAKPLYDELLDALEAASVRLDKFLGMNLPEKDSREEAGGSEHG